jgi:crotonobetainyl-CoA:carnitine CoA-transferase CaiB-like acyl-CoA transferase
LQTDNDDQARKRDIFMPFQPASDILSQYTVLDLTRVRSGPTCVRQLADWGANVIKIEDPETEKVGLGGPRHGSDFQNLHRNKRSITLNLKAKGGVEILKKLVERADVIVENYRPDVKNRLGIGYEELSKINPKLIYASISGFGQDGPGSQHPGFDQIAQGMGGLMSITGEPGRGPMRVGIPIADLTAGIFCSQGILLALMEREKSGKGQWVQTSLLQAQVFMLDFQASRWLMDKDVPGQAGNDHPTSIPTGVFKTKDGHINIAVAGNAMWAKFKGLFGDEGFEALAFKDGPARSKNRKALNALIEKHTVQRTSGDWIAYFNEQGIPAGPINDIKQVFEDAQVQHLQLARDFLSQERGASQIVGQPILMSRSKSAIAAAPPKLGQHTEEILKEIGYKPAQIKKLKEEGAV